MEIHRSIFYYKPRIKGFIQDNKFIPDNILANEIHDIWQKYPFMGYRKIAAMLRLYQGYDIDNKRASLSDIKNKVDELEKKLNKK